MSLWADQLLPRLLDKMSDPPELREQRRRACAGLVGEVLEIGFGSGLNAKYYPPSVVAVTAVEPNGVARRLAARRLPQDPPVTFAGLDAHALPFGNSRFDSALSTLTLCSLHSPAIAPEELHRVLKPGGTFHFLEHGLAPDRAVQRWQRRLEPAQQRCLGGCHLTRDIEGLLAQSGFVAVDLRQFYLLPSPTSRPYLSCYRGVAR